jgi:light-regulated signal transduction histidine kinase (bacteriophytochrome)
LAAAAALSAVVLGLDLLVPLGVAVGALYVPAVIVAANAKLRDIVVVGAACALLTMLVFAVTFNDATSWMAAVNRVISVSAISVATLLTVRQKRLTLLNTRNIERLGAKNKELLRYTSIAAHDLQEPVRNILSLSTLLLRRHRENLNESGQQIVGFIHDGAARMRLLISDLLDYSKLGEAVEFAETDLNTVLESVLLDLDEALRASGGAVSAEPLPIVQGHEIGLRQVFQNLISNSLKFADTDTPPQIKIWHEDAGGAWRIYLQDNGIGFDPGHTEKAFALFGRLHLREEYPGTGIGLSICRRVADLHGGDISVETAPGAGAKFTLTLPKSPMRL